MDADQLTSIKMAPKKRVILKEIKIESPEEKLANITKKVKYQLENHSAIYDSSVADLIRENNKLLVENGWKPCQVIGIILPQDCLVEIYRNYNDFKAKKKSFIYKGYHNKDYLLLDTYLNEHFLDKNPAKVIIKDKEHTLNYYHLEDLINQGIVQATYALVNRNTKMWTDFPHYFYNNRKAPRDWEIPAGQTFGIEIEVNFKSAFDKLKFSNELNAILPKWYCERDGSLEDHDSNNNKGLGGLEIISAPLNFRDLIDEAKIACNLLNKYNAKAFGAGEFFGLHVTHSLDVDADTGVVNKKQGWNYLRYLNEPKLREFWRCIARRKPNAYCVFIDDFIGNYGENPRLNTLTRGHSENNHHLATCVRDSQKAIETRIFCSTKGIKTLEATLEIIKLTSDFSREKFDLKAYSDYITNNASRNLASFLKSRGALYCLEAMYLPDYDDNEENF